MRRRALVLLACTPWSGHICPPRSGISWRRGLRQHTRPRSATIRRNVFFGGQLAVLKACTRRVRLLSSWSFVRHRLSTLLRGVALGCVQGCSDRACSVLGVRGIFWLHGVVRDCKCALFMVLTWRFPTVLGDERVLQDILRFSLLG